MPMSVTTYNKLRSLNYNGEVEDLYNSIRAVFERAFINCPSLIDQVIERLTAEDFEEILQLEVC